MYTCSFFGDMKRDNLAPPFFDCLFSALEFLIEKENVSVFYTTAHNEFDLICETILFDLQKKYPHIVIIKYAAKKYRQKASDSKYEKVINYEDSNCKNRCKAVAELSDYIIFESMSEGTGGNIFSEILFNIHPRGIFDIRATLENAKKTKSKK